MSAIACALGQKAGRDQQPRVELPTDHWYDRYLGPYTPPTVSPPDFANSPRIYDLIRAGNLYLSLADAIALVIENSLDVEVERYVHLMAQADILRTQGGGLPRGISLIVGELPAGIGGPATPLLTAAATGVLAGTTVPTTLVELTAILPSESGIAITGAANFATGPPVPLYDPQLTGSILSQRATQPQASTFVTGTSSLITKTFTGTLGFQQGFSLGTLIATNFNSSRQSTNSTRSTLTPFVSSTGGFTITQPLLRGFGIALNRRFIHIARNNAETMDLVFRQQAIATVSDVVRLYYDLVSLQEDVRVKQDTLNLAEQLYRNNRLQVEQGTLAPIELTRAQANVAAAMEDLANSRGFEEAQELIVKSVITKRGTADPAVRAAHVVLTNTIDVRVEEPVRPVEDLVGEALRSRPELQEARLQIQNSRLALLGSRNEMLPQLDVVGTWQNAGLAGEVNPAIINTPGPGGLVQPVDQANLGGFLTGLGQIFTSKYPTYSIGLQLTLPLRNRIAEADVIRDELQLREWQVRYQQLENQVRLEVEAAVIALNRTRAAYEAAVQARILQERSLQAEMLRYTMGVSTSLLVMQYQSFVAQARATEVAAKGVYAKARTALERALGATLQNHSVNIAEVRRGQVVQPVVVNPALNPGLPPPAAPRK